MKEISKSAPSSPAYSHSVILNQATEKQKENKFKENVHYPLTPKAVDVFGEEREPICNYLRCHHKFSVHGLSSGKCRCKHPQNAAIGA